MQLKKTYITLKYKQQNKIGKLGIIKIQKFCYAKDHYKRLKRLGLDWKKNPKKPSEGCISGQGTK